MNNSLFDITSKLKNSSINNKYIYIGDNAKFIYNNSSLNEVVGMNNLLNGKVIEVINEIERNDKKFVLVKIDSTVLGWTEISDEILIRLYRMPKVTGKLNKSIQNDDILFNTNQDDINQIDGKMLRAKYIFYYSGERYVNVTRIDGSNSFFIRDNKFNKLIVPKEETKIFLEKEHSMYSSSNFNVKASVTKFDKEYNVLSYIDKTDEVKIEDSGNHYWVKKELKTDGNHEYKYNLETLDAIDFITYLFENNKYNEGRVRILNNKIDKIKNRIKYNNIDEEFLIKNYLGDTDGN